MVRRERKHAATGVRRAPPAAAAERTAATCADEHVLRRKMRRPHHSARPIYASTMIAGSAPCLERGSNSWGHAISPCTVEIIRRRARNDWALLTDLGIDNSNRSQLEHPYTSRRGPNPLQKEEAGSMRASAFRKKPELWRHLSAASGRALGFSIDKLGGFATQGPQRKTG